MLLGGDTCEVTSLCLVICIFGGVEVQAFGC